MKPRGSSAARLDRERLLCRQCTWCEQPVSMEPLTPTSAADQCTNCRPAGAQNQSRCWGTPVRRPCRRLSSSMAHHLRLSSPHGPPLARTTSSRQQTPPQHASVTHQRSKRVHFCLLSRLLI